MAATSGASGAAAAAAAAAPGPGSGSGAAPALYACTKCNQRYPFEELSQGQQLCKVPLPRPQGGGGGREGPGRPAVLQSRGLGSRIAGRAAGLVTAGTSGELHVFGGLFTRSPGRALPLLKGHIAFCERPLRFL